MNQEEDKKLENNLMDSINISKNTLENPQEKQIEGKEVLNNFQFQIHFTSPFIIQFSFRFQP